MRAKFPKSYLRQIQRMAQKAMAWRKANPTKEALVQFNYPEKVMLIAPISAALKQRLVSTNEAGLELVKALGPWDKTEPSVFMVRLALEHQPFIKVTHRHDISMTCPECRTRLDTSRALTGKSEPEASDLTVCVRCGAMCQYNATVTGLVSLSAEEMAALDEPTRKLLVAASDLAKKLSRERAAATPKK